MEDVINRNGRSISFRQKQINGVTSWAVETEVTAEFDVRHQLWDKMPEYWVLLYERVILSVSGQATCPRRAANHRCGLLPQWLSHSQFCPI